MILSTKERYIYVPRANGNDKLPPSEQFRCEIIRATAEEADTLSSLEIARDFFKREIEEADKSKDAAAGKITTRLTRRQDTSRILREHIGKCWNLAEDVISEGGKKTRRAITSGAELADSRAFGIKDLVDELCAEVLRDKLEEDEVKNSVSASSST